MDKTRFRHEVELILDRYSPCFAHDAPVNAEFVKGWKRNRSLKVIVAGLDEGDLLPICAVLERFEAYLGPHQLVRLPEELGTLKEFFQTVMKRVSTEPREVDQRIIAALDEGTLRAHLLQMDYRRLCSFAAERKALATGTLRSRRHRVFQSFPDATARDQVLTVSQFDRLRQFLAERLDLLRSTVADPPAGGHSLEPDEMKEILASILPDGAEIQFQLALRSDDEVGAMAQSCADPQTLHKLLCAEFKEDYLSLYHNVLCLNVLATTSQKDREYAAVNAVEEANPHWFTFAEWRHMRQLLDLRQLDLRNLALQRLNFPSEADFAAAIDQILPTAGMVKQALKNFRRLPRDQHQAARSASPVEHSPPPRLRTPITSPRARTLQPFPYHHGSYSLDDPHCGGDHHSRTPTPVPNDLDGLLGEAPASPNLPSAHMDLPDFPYQFSLGARPVLGLRAARHYQTTPARWAASRRW